MLKSALVVLALTIATLIAGACTWATMAKVTETKDIHIASRDVPGEVVKARVVYDGYLSEAALANIRRQTVGSTPNPPIPTKPSVSDLSVAVSKTGEVSKDQPLDLNAASIEDLNGAGGGMIGKAIARGRPYNSVNDLLMKRIVNRATFETIRHRVGVRT